MGEFRKLLISGANASINKLFIADIDSSNNGDAQVVVRSPSTGQLFVTSSYSEAGSRSVFSGSFNGNMELTVDAGSSEARFITLGKGRTSNGSGSILFYTHNTGDGLGLEITRDEGEDGNSTITHHGTNDFIIKFDNPGTSNPSFIIRGDNGNNLFRVQQNGNVYLQNLPQASTAANLFYDTSTKRVTYGFDNSTKRVKTNIKNIDDSLVKDFDKLRPVNYSYKITPHEKEGGFIAEELAKIHSSLVCYGPNYAVTPSGSLDMENPPIDDQIVPNNIKDRTLLALIVAKIQELDNKIQELKKLKK